MLNNSMHGNCRRFAAAVAGAALLPPSAFSQADCYYTWEEIRVNGGICLAWDINNLGHVVGEIDIGGDNTLAFLWSPESGVGVLPFPDGVISMAAYAINDSGQVVGVMNNTVETLGFVWQAGVGYSVIDPPSPRGLIYVKDINNRGEVVGSVFRRTPPAPWLWTPFVWEAGILTELPVPFDAFDAIPSAINELGQIAGDAWRSDAKPHAFLIEDRTDFAWLPEPLGATSTRVGGLNNNGVVVGYGPIPNPAGLDGIVWTDGQIRTFTAESEWGNARLLSVNDAGRAVGYVGTAFYDAIAWQSDAATTVRTMVASPPFHEITTAQAMNNSGQIVGGSAAGALVLTPNWMAGDVTGDCHVSLEDLALTLIDFGSAAGSFPRADTNHDGQVDLLDLAILLSQFGR